MQLNHKEISGVWAQQLNEHKGVKLTTTNNQLFAQDEIIYSYGEHFPLGKYLGKYDEKMYYLVSNRKYSKQTAKHQAWLLSALRFEWMVVIECDDLLADEQVEHEANIQKMLDQLVELFERKERSVKHDYTPEIKKVREYLKQYIFAFDIEEGPHLKGEYLWVQTSMI